MSMLLPSGVVALTTSYTPWIGFGLSADAVLATTSNDTTVNTTPRALPIGPTYHASLATSPAMSTTDSERGRPRHDVSPRDDRDAARELATFAAGVDHPPA